MQNNITTQHSLTKFFIGLVFGLIVGFVLGWWLCGRGQAVSTTTTIKVDTVKYYKPMSIANPTRPTMPKFDLPRYVYAPGKTRIKTVVKTVVVTEDSKEGEEPKEVEVTFPIERREYRDSTYFAIVSGAVVGDSRPTLDYIETYNKTVTSEVVIQPKKLRPYVGASVGIFGTWSVGVGGGLLIKDHHAVGAEYERTQTDNRLKLNYSYLF